MKADLYQSNNSVENLRQYEYIRTMGGYRPKFSGIPEEYYPLKATETFLYLLFVVLTIGGVLGLMIGFLFWITNRGLESYTIVWSIVFLVFVVLMMILFYIGGRARIRDEKNLIAEQQAKQESMANKDNHK